ncbi:MAG TPA: ABC transporter substrate-binding protein [Thermomicrobiales bacterium]|nr:ABC transporter substrate-binding protein [Thermomicrobiales bacterium]
MIANEAEPADLSPWFKGFGHVLVTRQLYETLVEPRMTQLQDGTVDIEWVPVLAESWEQIEPTRWRFTLRQGVTFHNGESFDASAVKASYDALNDDEAAAAAGGFNILRGTAGCEVVDAATVDILTPVPNNELLGSILRLGFVALPPAMLNEQGLEAFSENPVGTGPYRFSTWSRGQDIVLERYEEYWDTEFPATFAAIRSFARPEAGVRAQTVASGEADFAFNIGAEQASALDHSVTGGGFQSTSLRVNNQIAPTSDQNVRLALNLAVDRQAIVDSIFLGHAQPAAFFGFQPVSLDPYPYDPERATQLIADAGLAGTELELVYGEGRIPEEDQLAELYKAFFEAIGLVITLTKVEPVQYNEIGARPFAEQPPLYMETTSSGNYGEIASGLADKYGSEGTGTFSDPEFDARFEELQTLDGEARAAELQSIAEDLHEIAPRVWVAIVQQVHGISDKLAPDLPLNAYVRVQDMVG